MMNYIFFNSGYWLIRKFFLDTSNGSFSIGFQPTATLGKMLKGTNTHYGLLHHDQRCHYHVDSDG